MTTHTDIPAILTALHDAFLRRDMETIAHYFDEDVRFVTPDGELLGKTARIADEQRIFDMFDDSSVEVTSAVVDGDQAVELSILHGTAKVGPQPGVRIALRYVCYYRFQDARIVFQEVVFDRSALKEKLGMAA